MLLCCKRRLEQAFASRSIERVRESRCKNSCKAKSRGGEGEKEIKASPMTRTGGRKEIQRCTVAARWMKMEKGRRRRGTNGGGLGHQLDSDWRDRRSRQSGHSCACVLNQSALYWAFSEAERATRPRKRAAWKLRNAMFTWEWRRWSTECDMGLWVGGSWAGPARARPSREAHRVARVVQLWNGILESPSTDRDMA